MDFFSRQDESRRNTKRLVFYFTLGVLSTIVAVYMVVLLIFGFSQNSRKSRGYHGQPAAASFSLWQPQLFLFAAGGTIAVVAFGSLFKISQLSRGGSVIATELGGQPLNPHSNDPDEIKLRNVVEEMALASGVSVPDVYILREEDGINAFAAGFSTSDAVIGVTRGAIEHLTRDELQGVIAHEFSHILNGDMKLNLRLIGWVHGIICLALLGHILIRSQRYSTNRKNGGGAVVLGLGLLEVGSIGAFFGKLIKSAISRQREFLADAAAVQFTRNPHGIAGALKKIGGIAYGSQLQAPAAAEASHMFFGDGISKWSSLMATHPPLVERIRAIDPQFDGTFPRVELSAHNKRKLQETMVPEPPRIRDVRPPQLHDLLGGAPRVQPAQLVQTAGTPGRAHLNFAENILNALPAELSMAAHEPFAASALVYALLLSDDDAARDEQLFALRPHISEPLYKELLHLLPQVQELPKKAKLPLVELAVPALRQLSPAQYHDFEKHIKLLVAADKQVDLFEFALEKLLLRHFEPQFKGAPRRIVQFYSLLGLADDCAVLLSAIAHVGHKDAALVREAFAKGVRELKLEGTSPRLSPLNACSLDRLDTALNHLAQASPQCKKTFLQAAAHAVAYDGEVKAEEAELLRAIADSLDCPIPPVAGR